MGLNKSDDSSWSADSYDNYFAGFDSSYAFKEEVCEYCGAVFEKQHLLRKHMKNHANGEESFPPNCFFHSQQEFMNMHPLITFLFVCLCCSQRRKKN